MAKWADYLISGIWLSGEHISHVMLHTDTDTTFSAGRKATEAEVIALLKIPKSIKTIKWNYKDAKWEIGAKVDYAKANNREYLRTDHNLTESDNLRHLINMSGFF